MAGFVGMGKEPVDVPGERIALAAPGEGEEIGGTEEGGIAVGVA
jgi:hypothetical protein